MLNEPDIQRYMNMPLLELESRSLQLDGQRQHIGKGRMPHGMSVYRRRLMKALTEKRAEQASQQTRYMQSKERHVNSRLTPQQRYDKGRRQGRQDGLSGCDSQSWEIEDSEERQGYNDAFRVARAEQSRPRYRYLY